VPHLVGTDGAYVTADYTIKAKTGDRVTEGGGWRHTPVKDSRGWKIRTRTSPRRRAPGDCVQVG
jgi:hypothetical protein